MFAGPLGRSTFTPPKSSFDSPLYGLVSLRRSHRALSKAEVADESYAAEWIESVRRWDLATGMHQIFKDLPPPETLLSVEERAVLLSKSAAEGMRLAREFTLAARAIDGASENPTSLLVKVGRAIDDALLATHLAVPRGEILELFEILKGKKVLATATGDSDAG